jgi:hypothetical protein
VVEERNLPRQDPVEQSNQTPSDAPEAKNQQEISAINVHIEVDCRNDSS